MHQPLTRRLHHALQRHRVDGQPQHRGRDGRRRTDHKTSDPAGTGTIVENNIGSLNISDGSTMATDTHNLYAEQAPDINRHPNVQWRRHPNHVGRLRVDHWLNRPPCRDRRARRWNQGIGRIPAERVTDGQQKQTSPADRHVVLALRDRLRRRVDKTLKTKGNFTPGRTSLARRDAGMAWRRSTISASNHPASGQRKPN